MTFRALLLFDRHCRLLRDDIWWPSGGLPLADLSTPGQGQGEGPDDSEFERSEDEDGVGGGRSERSERSSARGRLPEGIDK